MSTYRKIFFGISLTAFLFMGTGAFVVWPQIKGVVDDANALAQQKQEKNTFLAEQRNLAYFTACSRQHQPELQEFTSLFVDPNNPVEFLVFMETIAKESQLGAKIIPGNPQKVKGDFWPSIGFQVSVQAPFSQIRSFLQKLEYGPYALEMQNATIQSMKDAKAPQVVTLHATFKLYTQ